MEFITEMTAHYFLFVLKNKQGRQIPKLAQLKGQRGFKYKKIIYLKVLSLN